MRELDRAIKLLNREQTGPSPPAHREITAVEYDPRRFGADALAEHVRLWRVDVETR